MSKKLELFYMIKKKEKHFVEILEREARKIVRALQADNSGVGFWLIGLLYKLEQGFFLSFLTSIFILIMRQEIDGP